MAKIRYDVSGVEEGQDFDKPIPVGVYVVKISESKEDTSKSGNPMLALVLQVQTPKEHKGRQLWEYIVESKFGKKLPGPDVDRIAQAFLALAHMDSEFTSGETAKDRQTVA